MKGLRTPGLLALFALSTAEASCLFGASSSPASRTSCVVPESSVSPRSYCIGYAGSGTVMDAANACAGVLSNSARFHETPCDTRDLVARCRLDSHVYGLTLTIHYYMPMTSAEARSACAPIGTLVTD